MEEKGGLGRGERLPQRDRTMERERGWAMHQGQLMVTERRGQMGETEGAEMTGFGIRWLTVEQHQSGLRDDSGLGHVRLQRCGTREASGW